MAQPHSQPSASRTPRVKISYIICRRLKVAVTNLFSFLWPKRFHGVLSFTVQKSSTCICAPLLDRHVIHKTTIMFIHVSSTLKMEEGISTSF